MIQIRIYLMYTFRSLFVCSFVNAYIYKETLTHSKTQIIHHTRANIYYTNRTYVVYTTIACVVYYGSTTRCITLANCSHVDLMKINYINWTIKIIIVHIRTVCTLIAHAYIRSIEPESSIICGIVCVSNTQPISSYFVQRCILYGNKTL